MLASRSAVSQRNWGQPLTPTILRRMGNCPPPARTKVASVPRARAGRATQALRVLSWNAGHLGQQQWSEVKSWLLTEASQTCDVLVLQETHWQATAEFTASGWYCVSSASPDDTLKANKSKKRRGGTAQTVKETEARPESSQEQTRTGPSVARADGVMVLMSPRVAAKSVRWKEHVVGRALEVRFDWQGARVTVVAVYRASLLKALGRCVKQVPHRDTLILAGDYNSSLAKQPRLVGPAVTSPREPRPDEPELSNFLHHHRLVALNTWQPLSPHTFVQGGVRTQIDFIFTREMSAGRQAKQASPLLDFPLGSWKKGGHCPIQASVTPVRHWNLPGPQTKPLQHDSAALQEAVRALLRLRGCLNGSRNTSTWIQAPKHGMNC